MDNLQSIKILMQVAIVAQSRGALDLDEAVLAKNSIDNLKELVEKLEKEKLEKEKKGPVKK